jgi:hypothetical protein
MSAMRVRKAVITAAAKDQRVLPMQILFDQEGAERSVLSLVVHEAIRADIGDVGSLSRAHLQRHRRNRCDAGCTAILDQSGGTEPEGCGVPAGAARSRE